MRLGVIFWEELGARGLEGGAFCGRCRVRGCFHVLVC